MKTFFWDENSCLWWKCLIELKIYHFDENSSLGQRFFTLMKDLSVMKIHKCDKKNYHSDKKEEVIWWKFHCDENFDLWLK